MFACAVALLLPFIVFGILIRRQYPPWHEMHRGVTKAMVIASFLLFMVVVGWARSQIPKPEDEGLRALNEARAAYAAMNGKPPPPPLTDDDQ